MKDKLIAYHSQSEDVFKTRMPQIAITLNKLKPYVIDLGIGIKFTDVGIDLIKGHYNVLDKFIMNYVQEKGGGIDYVQQQIKLQVESSIVQIRKIAESIANELNYLRPTTPTIDRNECIDISFLSKDQENDVFICDSHAVDRVKPRFEIRFDNEGLQMYDDLKKIAVLTEKVKKMGNSMGFSYDFNPMNLLSLNDDEGSCSVDLIGLYEDWRFLTK